MTRDTLEMREVPLEETPLFRTPTFSAPLISRLRLALSGSELGSIVRNGVEYMHGGGRIAFEKQDVDKMGWQHSDLVMFPVVGIARARKWMHTQEQAVKTPRGIVAMGQHGIARHLNYDIAEGERSRAVRQSYSSNATLTNESGKTPAQMRWPYSCTVEKNITIESGSVVVVRLQVTNNDTEPMPYQLGWHPAFRLGGEHAVVGVGKTPYHVSVIQGLPTEQPAMLIKGAQEATLYRGDKHGVSIASDLEHLMLWSRPGTPYVCIEPVTNLPESGKPTKFTKSLSPGESHLYSVRMTFF